MENKKEMTIPNVSAATDAEQSLSKCTDNSIVNQDTDFKGYEQSFEEMQREILRQLDPSYLKTVSMTTLYDTVFERQQKELKSNIEKIVQSEQLLQRDVRKYDEAPEWQLPEPGAFASAKSFRDKVVKSKWRRWSNLTDNGRLSRRKQRIDIYIICR